MITPERVKIMQQDLQDGKPVLVYSSVCTYDSAKHDTSMLKSAGVEELRVTSIGTENVRFLDSKGERCYGPCVWYHATRAEAEQELLSELKELEACDNRLVALAQHNKLVIEAVRNKLTGDVR